MIKSGVEGGVAWHWVGDLAFTLDGTQVPVHPVHAKHVAQLGSNRFYGSFTLVSNNGQALHGDKVIEAYPTKDNHTEPQYFTWLGQQFNRPEVLLLLLNTKAIVLEVNQTNTPCSGQQCRPRILNTVNALRYGNAYFIARLSAYQVYQHQYPKVILSSFDAQAIRQQPESVALTGPAVVHKVTDI